MASSKDTTFDCTKLLATTLSKAKTRWRIAYLTIYSARAMLSLVRDVIVSDTNSCQHSGILHNVSYNVLNTVEPTVKNHVAVPDVIEVDKNRLTEMVKEKDSVALRQFGE